MSKIKVYRWEHGKILKKEINKSDLKSTVGWKADPEEAMLVQLKNKKSILENDISSMCDNIDNIILLEDYLVKLNIKRTNIPQENNFGLSKSSIKELVFKLNLLLERSE